MRRGLPCNINMVSVMQRSKNMKKYGFGFIICMTISLHASWKDAVVELAKEAGKGSANAAGEKLFGIGIEKSCIFFSCKERQAQKIRELEEKIKYVEMLPDSDKKLETLQQLNQDKEQLILAWLDAKK